MMNNMGFPGFVFMIVVLVIAVIPFWKIWERTGHSPLFSLLIFVPIVNIISLYVLAFKSWPIEGEQG